MQQIAPDVYIATQYNLVTVGAVLTSEGWICIDTPPYPRDARHWLGMLQSTEKIPVRYIINTDAHRDRILCNEIFSAPVIAHQNAAQTMLEFKNSFIAQAAEELSSNDNELVDIASLTLAPPHISFSDSLHLPCGNRTLELKRKPGTTAGNLWVILPDEKIIFAGDTLFFDHLPLIQGSNTEAWLELLGEFSAGQYDDWKVISGREGMMDNPKQVEPLAEYLQTIRQKVSDLLQDDYTRTDVTSLATELTEAFPHHQHDEVTLYSLIKASLESVYDELLSQETAPEEEQTGT